MGEVISSEMCCDGNKQARATMETADNERGENMYEKHSNCLPNKSQINNRCQMNGVKIKTGASWKSSAARFFTLPYGHFVSHLLGPEPIS